MQKILKVAQREYIETVKTKTFIFMILMLPVMILLIVYFAGKRNDSGSAGRPSPAAGVGGHPMWPGATPGS